MLNSTNNFKQLLASGKTLYGLWLALANAYSAEVCASAGFDWLLIDGEHAPNDLLTILSQLQAVAAFSSHPVVRLPSQDTALIKQVLDLGASNLLIPMVESKEQAENLVAAVRYPPHGIRGVGSSIARASMFSRDYNYLQHANDKICLLLQVESVTGIQALTEITSVDGVDGVFIGPADLAASMGNLGQPMHPEVQGVIEEAAMKIRTAGKAAGILATNEDFIQNSMNWGYNFVAVGVDILLLAHSTHQLIARYKN